MPITYDQEMYLLMLEYLERIQAAKDTSRYLKCVQAGGSWVGCMLEQITRRVTISVPGLEEQYSYVAELLALLPEDEQPRILESVVAAQEALLERYTAEIEELSGML